MTVPSGTASRQRRLICPFCESGKLLYFGAGFARCGSCGLPLLGSTLETLADVIGLPDALGAHPCDCGHPKMRKLPDGVFHCPACRSEVLPVEAPSGEGNERPASVWSMAGETSAQGREAAPDAGRTSRLSPGRIAGPTP